MFGSWLPQNRINPTSKIIVFGNFLGFVSCKKKILLPIFILRDYLIFSYLNMLSLGFEIGYKWHSMSLLCTFNEFDQKTFYSYRILGFGIFFAFRRPQNSNSGKTQN